jgi:hypothetical protein
MELVQVDAFDAESSQAPLTLRRIESEPRSVRISSGGSHGCPHLVKIRTSSPMLRGAIARATTSSECPSP